MPVMNGPTAAETMREIGSDACIIGITGNVLPGDIKLFLSAGANAILPKPVNVGDVENLWMEYGLLQS